MASERASAAGPGREVWTVILLTLGVFVALYWRYPLGGMTIEQSWALYADSASTLRGSLGDGGAGIWVRRGLFDLLCRAAAAAAPTPAAINLLCIAAQVTNIALFGGLVWRLAGREQLVPAVAVALLYPFASGAHFWQIALLHHVTVMLVLLSCLLVFPACAALANGRWVRAAAAGAGGVGAYALSLWLLEHAVFLWVFHVLLVRRFAPREGRGRAGAMVLGAAYAGIGVAAAGWLLTGGHPRIAALSSGHAEQFAGLAAALHLPATWMPALVAGANAGLFALSALWANSIGLLGYPVWDVLARGRWLLTGHLGLLNVVAAVAVMATLLWWARAHLRRTATVVEPTGAASAARWGLLWAALAYLPYMGSLAYPGVVGQVADRVNVLALFGVALAAGVAWSHALSWVVRSSGARMMAGTVLTLVTGLLVAHLGIQREIWIESYLKEQHAVTRLLEAFGHQDIEGRRPVLFLVRDDASPTLRDRVQVALEEPDRVRRLAAVARVILARHFTARGEMEATAFHLQGVPLFGGGPDGAAWIFASYARRLGVPPVAAYKMEPGFSLDSQGDRFVIAYDGRAEAAYRKREVLLIEIRFGREFFSWRGRPNYAIRPVPVSQLARGDTERTP